MNLKVRPLQTADLSAAGQVYAASWRYSHAQVCSQMFLDAHTGESMARRLDEARRGGAQVLLALADGEAAGIAVLDTQAREIRQLYVAPPFFGRGVGRELLNRALALLGDGEVTLTVMSVNTRARRFYEKYGFTPRGTERVLDAQTGLCELRYARE